MYIEVAKLHISEAYIEVVKLVISAVFISIITITDYKDCKIRNKHVLVFMVLGLAINVIDSGLAGISDSICGLLLPMALLPLFALRMLGGGDIKALCAIGSIVGFDMSLYITLLSFVAGGVIALGFMCFRKNAKERMKQFFIYLKLSFYMRKLISYDQFNDEKSRFRFSLGILGGFVMAVFWTYAM